MAGPSFLEYISDTSPETNIRATPEGFVPGPPTSALPAIGSAVGGIAGALGTKLPYVGPLLTLGMGAERTGLLAGAARTFAPSLIGSTAGTAVGLGGETLLGGGLPSGDRIMGELAENAAFDIGGNLVFSAAGKTFRVARPVLANVLPFLKETSPEAARKAAQEFLSKEGATLTRGQLTGNVIDVGMEELARGGTGASVFKTQEEGVRKAIESSVEQFKTDLGTSDAFKTALQQGDPTQMALGDNFKAAITVARDAFKGVHRPFYEKLTQDTGAYVDMRNIKAQAQKEYNRLAEGKFAGAAADKKTKLEDVLKQEDFVDFGIAHDIRSNFGAAARDKVEAGGKATTLSAGYSRYEGEISKAMDDSFAMVGPTRKRVEDQGYKFTPSAAESPVAMTTGQTGFNPYLKRTEETKSLVNEYANTQRSYKEGMNGLYNTTLTKAMEAEPEQVGKFLFNPESPSRMRDVFKAVAQVDKYKKTDIVNGLKYGFIEQAMSSPENVLKLSKVADQDQAFKEGLNYLFKGPGEKEFLTNVLGAAKYGMDEGAASRLIQNKTILQGTRIASQGGLLAGGYLFLPEDIKNKITNNLPETVATAGVLLFTPRFIAKAMTSKAGQDALADLAKVQSNPKLLGALSAKIANNFNKSGIIDDAYLTEISNKLNPQGQEQQAVPTTVPGGANFMDYLNQ